MSGKIDRRHFMALTGSGIVGLGAAAPQMQEFAEADESHPRVLMLLSFDKGIYYYNPAGLHIQPGGTVEWAGVGRRSVTAFYPANDNHELRIPENAEPFDSRKVETERGTFRWKFQVEGTYDYYCAPTEYLGMVGRIVVGRPGGPAERPPGYGNREGRTVMYPDSARMLEYLTPEMIVREKVVPCPLDLLSRKFPWR